MHGVVHVFNLALTIDEGLINKSGVEVVSVFEMVLGGVLGIRVIILIIRIAFRVAESVAPPESIVINIQVLHVELCNLAHKTGVSCRRDIRCVPVALWFSTIVGWRLLSFDALSASFSLNFYVTILTHSTISSLFLVESVPLKSIR